MKLMKPVLWTVFGVVAGGAVLLPGSRVQAQQKPATVTQAKPDFSGTWVSVSPTEAIGHQQEIRHTPTTLSFVRASDGQIVSYPLDGKERISESKEAEGERVITATTSSWIGDKVAIVKVTTSPLRRTVELKQVFYLDSTGRLVVEFSQATTGFPLQSMTMVCTKKTMQ